MTPLFAQFYGIEAVPSQLQKLKDGRPDGVLLLRRNIETPDQVRELTGTLRRELGEGLEIAVCHEGGAVTPFVRGVTAFPGLEALEAAGNAALARDVGRAMGAELAGMGITTNLVRDGGPMTEEFRLGLRCSGIKAGQGPVVPANGRTSDDGEGASLAKAVADGALKIVRDPRRLIPLTPGRTVGLLVPRLGDVADRVPIEDGLRATAHVLRPRVGASVAVLEIAVQPDDATVTMAADWMASQEVGVFFCFQAGRFAGQRKLLEALAKRCANRIIVTIGDSADEARSGPDATVLRTCGFQACQLTAALRTIFPPPPAVGKRK